jgi:prophage regulatory protein
MTAESPPSTTIERRQTSRRAADANEIRMLHLKDVMKICGLGRTSVYDAVQRGEFPAPVPLLTRAPRWKNQEIQAWLSQQIKISRVK